MIKRLLLSSFLAASISFAEDMPVIAPMNIPAPQAVIPKSKKKKAKSTSTGDLPQPPAPPKKSTAVETQDAISKIHEANKTVQQINEQNTRCKACELQERTQTTGGTSTRAEELIQQKKIFDANAANQNPALAEPKTDVNSTGNRSAMCGDRPGNYQVCIFNGEVSPGQIKLTNKTGALPREWLFEFAGQARQDMGVLVSDYNDNALSKSKYTYLMVFPRRYLPSIRTEGVQQIVTLPTGETVTYDTNTKKILSGALTENKTYTGSNVVIKADRTGEEPRLGKGSATISKNGKSCKVPLKELWPDQSESSALHFKYASDQAFDEFLKKKCGFSIY